MSKNIYKCHVTYESCNIFYVTYIWVTSHIFVRVLGSIRSIKIDLRTCTKRTYIWSLFLICIYIFIYIYDIYVIYVLDIYLRHVLDIYIRHIIYLCTSCISVMCHVRHMTYINIKNIYKCHVTYESCHIFVVHVLRSIRSIKIEGGYGQ